MQDYLAASSSSREALRLRMKDLDFEREPLMDHVSLEATMVYTHVAESAGARSLLEGL